MPNTVEVEDPESLGVAVRSRMRKLGLRDDHVMDRTRSCDESLSKRWFSNVKNGHEGARDVYKLACLSRVLDWPADALQRIAAGEDPDSIPDEPWEEEPSGDLEGRIAKLEWRMERLMTLVEQRLDGPTDPADPTAD